MEERAKVPDHLNTREATRADIDELAAVGARAFEDDPIMRWILPNDRTRVERLTRMFGLMFNRVAVPAGRHMLTTTELSGLAIWAPPDTWKIPASRTLKLAPRLVSILGRGFIRLARGFAALEKRHPHEPHWYLEGLATDPPWQRRGVGGALMAPVLARCDEEGVGAYLETQKEANVPYYRRHGFEITGEMDLPGNGPHIWLMWRDPRG